MNDNLRIFIITYIKGLLCPECMKEFVDVNELSEHFETFHKV